MKDLAPLLNEILCLRFQETSRTLGISLQARAEKARSVALSAAGSDRSNMMFVLENAQWFDPASWALLPHVMKEIQPLLIVLTRPLLGDHHRCREAARTLSVNEAGQV